MVKDTFKTLEKAHPRSFKTQSAKAGSGSSSAKAAAPKTSAPPASSASSSSAAPPAKSKSRSALPSKTKKAGGSKSSSNDAGGKSKSAAPVETEEDVDGATYMSCEQAEGAIEEFNSAVFAELKAAFDGPKWEPKKEAIVNLKEALVTLSGDEVAKMLEPTVVYLQKNTRMFKDSNFNIMRAVFETIDSLVSHTTTCTKKPLAPVMEAAFDKIGDRKLKVQNMQSKRILQY